jgi:hypothetical protein
MELKLFWWSANAYFDEVYYIVPGKCTECKGFHDEPQCAAVCPVDCCIPDNNVEDEETLLNRQSFYITNSSQIVLHNYPEFIAQDFCSIFK